MAKSIMPKAKAVAFLVILVFSVLGAYALFGLWNHKTVIENSTCPAFYWHNSTSKQCQPQTISPACPPNYPNSPTYFTCSGTKVPSNICPNNYTFNSAKSQCIINVGARTTSATTSITSKTSVPVTTTSAPSGTASNSTTTSTTIINTTSANPTTSILQSSNLTGKYLMVFLACSGSNCNNPMNHMTYLAQSNDGSNWTLVQGFKPYYGSVPDLVRRGGNLYIYNPGLGAYPGFVTTYNISTGSQSQPSPVILEYPNGTISPTSFVDPSPILNGNGTIILFYLPNIMGQDPAQCPVGQSSCTKDIMSATEVKGSNGTKFIIDPGVRIGININSPSTASDPAIFEGPSGYILYVSEGQSVVAFTSQRLQGNYTAIQSLPGGVLVPQGVGGVPEGYYDPSTKQYWTYTGTGPIRLAVTNNLDSQIQSSAFVTVVSGCKIVELGCSYDTDGVVGSPGFYPNVPNGVR